MSTKSRATSCSKRAGELAGFCALYMTISSFRAASRLTWSCSAMAKPRWSCSQASAGAAFSQLFRMAAKCWLRLFLRSCTSLARNSCRPSAGPPSHWVTS
ncbi:hypothetical protein D3C78_1087840 [compost metagenome]